MALLLPLLSSRNQSHSFSGHAVNDHREVISFLTALAPEEHHIVLISFLHGGDYKLGRRPSQLLGKALGFSDDLVACQALPSPQLTQQPPPQNWPFIFFVPTSGSSIIDWISGLHSFEAPRSKFDSHSSSFV